MMKIKFFSKDLKMFRMKINNYCPIYLNLSIEKRKKKLKLKLFKQVSIYLNCYNKMKNCYKILRRFLINSSSFNKLTQKRRKLLMKKLYCKIFTSLAYLNYSINEIIDTIKRITHKDFGTLNLLE